MSHWQNTDLDRIVKRAIRREELSFMTCWAALFVICLALGLVVEFIGVIME